MNTRQRRQVKMDNNAQSRKNESNESVDELLANVDNFIEGVYRDMGVSPPRRSVCLRPLDDCMSSSSSEANSPAETDRKRTVLSRVARRNMDAEIERINHICDNVDRNLRSIGLIMNSSAPDGIEESHHNTNTTTSPAASTSITIVNNTSPLVVPRARRPTNLRRRGTSSTATPVESFVDLSNSQTETPEPLGQSVDPHSDDDDDVILVADNRPSVVDLCTPGGHQEISRHNQIINHEHLNRRRLHPNSEADTVFSSAGPSSTRRRRTVSSIRPTETSPVNEATSVLSSDGRTPFMCPVCMESCLNRQPTSTVCGHVYCKSCIEQAITMTHKCPMCNKKITKKQTFRIYF